MQKEGTTILIKTHYMDEAMHCERVGLIKHGKLVAEGTPAGLIKQAGKDSLEDAFLVFAESKSEVPA
jgi:ABC-2 type transport system ATP-binding protein